MKRTTEGGNPYKKQKVVFRDKSPRRPTVKPQQSQRFVKAKDSLREKKYFDTNQATTAVGSDSAAALLVQDLAIVPQGLTVSSREGKKILCKSLQLKGVFFSSQVLASGAPTSILVRMSLVWDSEPDKAALVPATTDVYISNSSTSLTNRDNAPRFRILREWMADLNPITSAAAGATDSRSINQWHFSEFVSLKNNPHEIVWTKADTTGATANKVKGNLLLVFTFDSLIAEGTFMQWNARLDYDDQ